MPTKKIHPTIPAIVSGLRTSHGLLALGALLAFTPLKVVSFLLVILVTARLLALKLGIITRIVLSYGIVVSVIGLIAVCAWFLGTPLNAARILLILILCLALLLWLFKKNKLQEQTSFATDRHELAASLLAIGVIIFVAWPVLQNPTSPQLLRVISAGGDNSAHMNMVKTDDLNRGIAYGHNNRVNTPDGALTYPQTWHFNIAFTKWVGDPLAQFTGKPGRQLALYYATAVLWFGLLVFFIARLSLRLAERLTGRRSLIGALGVLAVCGIVTIHWLLQLFTYGFQTQTATLALLVAEIFVLAEALALPAAKRYPLLLLATLLAVSCNFVWVFVMPIAFGAVGLGLLLTLAELRKFPPAYFTVSLTALLAFAFVQPLLFVIFPVTYEFPMILQRGLINPVSMMVLLTIMVIVAGHAVVRRKDVPLRLTLIVAGGALAFSLGLMFYQLQTIHELRYFYYKSTYTFIVIGAALLAVAAADSLEQIFKHAQLKRSLLVVLTLLTIAATGLIGWQIKDPASSYYTDGTLGGMSPQAAEVVIRQVVKGPTISKGTTFIGSCNRGDDIRANQFLASLTQQAFRKGSSFDTGNLDERVIFGAISHGARTNPPENPITIVSSDQVVTSRLRAFLGDDIKKITIVELDATPETEPVSQCPDRIRDIRQYP